MADFQKERDDEFRQVFADAGRLEELTRRFLKCAGPWDTLLRLRLCVNGTPAVRIDHKEGGGCIIRFDPDNHTQRCMKVREVPADCDPSSDAAFALADALLRAEHWTLYDDLKTD